MVLFPMIKTMVLFPMIKTMVLSVMIGNKTMVVSIYFVMNTVDILCDGHYQQCVPKGRYRTVVVTENVHCTFCMCTICTALGRVTNTSINIQVLLR